MNKRKQFGKKIQIAKRFISLCLRIARTSELGNYMPLTWLLTLAWNESCTSRGISHYMITAQIVLGRYKALPLWVLLMNFYSLENCKCAWEESVSVTNGNIKGEEKLQDFTDLLKFHVPMHQRLCLLSERCCFYHCTQHCILWDEFCQLSIELLIYKTCQVSKGIGMQLVIKDVSAFKCTTHCAFQWEPRLLSLLCLLCPETGFDSEQESLSPTLLSWLSDFIQSWMW